MELEFKGTKYEIGKLTATDAMWLVLQIMQRAMPQSIEQQIMAEAKIPLANNITENLKNRPDMTPDDINRISKICLKAVKCYTMIGPNETLLPVVNHGMVDPMFKDLEYDLATTIALMTNVLIFNVQCFFAGGALNELLKMFSALSLADILPSTGISGPQ